MSERRVISMQLAPAAMIFLGLFGASSLFYFVVSFWSVKLYKLRADFTFANYLKSIEQQWSVLLFTLELSLVIGILTIMVGFLYAFIARFKLPSWAGPLLLIVLITLFGGYLMKIYAWKTILGNEGVLNTALMAIGIISTPISALLYSPGAVVVTLLHFALPFAVLPIYAAMRGIKNIEIEVARDLGASQAKAFSTIIVPRCRAGIVTAFSFSFLITAGDYVTPMLVGGKQTMIGNLIAPQFGSMFNWPLGSAMSFVMLAISVLVIWLFSRAMAWWCRV